MQHGHTIQFPQGVLKVVTLAELQNRDAWKRALQNRCKDHRYYEIVEETLQDGFEHHHLLLEDDSGNARGIQPVFFVRQNLVEGVPGKISPIVDRVRKIFPRFLTMAARRVQATWRQPTRVMKLGSQTRCKRAFQRTQDKTRLRWSC